MAATRFTEVMTGYVTVGAVDPKTGYEQGKRADTSCTFKLTIEVEDVKHHLATKDDWAVATGWVECDLFGGRTPVESGRFRLFDRVADPDRRAMRYRLPFRDGGGNPVELVGMKDVGNDPGLDIWKDTTHLSVEIRSGHNTGELEDPETPVLARGVIVIKPLDFMKQLTTFRGPPREVLAFAKAFGANLWAVYKHRG